MTNSNAPAISKPVSIANFLNMPSTAKFLQETLADKKSEFVSNLIALCDSDANLASCDPAALMKCAMNATSLNLPLNKNLGYAYIIPYTKKVGNNYVSVPNFQIGYKGFIQLAIRSNAYRYINATEIREGEIKRNKITGQTTFVGENPNGKIVGYMAYIELLSGFISSLYMTEEQIEEHALKYSKVYQSDKKNGTMGSKWSDTYERPKMAKKTVLKGLLGMYGLLSIEMQKAFEYDNEEADADGVSNASRASGNGFDESEVIVQEENSSVKPNEKPTEEPLIMEIPE